MKYILTLAALLIGGLLAIQGSINAQLSGYLRHPLQAALVNFMVGTCCLVLVNILLRTELPKTAQLTNIPIHLYIGGVFGALFVSSVVILIPKIGVATMLAATIGGQMAIASIIDHYGFFNVPIHHLSFGRIGGIFLILIGIFLIRRF